METSVATDTPFSRVLLRRPLRGTRSLRSGRAHAVPAGSKLTLVSLEAAERTGGAASLSRPPRPCTPLELGPGHRRYGKGVRPVQITGERGALLRETGPEK